MTNESQPLDQRARFIAGLIEAADYLRTHPDIPVPPYSAAFTAFVDDRAEVERIAELLGVAVTTSSNGMHHKAIVTFGPIQYEACHIEERSQEAWQALMKYQRCRECGTALSAEAIEKRERRCPACVPGESVES